MRPSTAAALVAALSLATTPARADPPTVSVTLAVGDSTDALRVSLDDLLGRVGARVTWATAPAVSLQAVLTEAPDEAHLARLWIDLPDATHARLVLLDRRSEHVWIRPFTLDHGFDEVARETLAHVTADAVDALAHGVSLGVAPATLRTADAPSPPPPPTPPPIAVTPAAPLTHPWRFIAALAGETQLRGASLALGAALHLRVARPLHRWTLGFEALAAPRLAWSLETSPFALRTTELAWRASAVAAYAVTPSLDLALSLGAGLDRVSVSHFAADDPRWSAVALDAFTTPVLRASAGLAVRPSAHLALWCSLATELDLGGTRFTAARNGVDTAVLTPWSVRPGLSLGVALTP